MTAARHHLSGSRIELADACLFPFRADVQWPVQVYGAAPRLGSALHAGAQETGEAAADRTVDEEELEGALRDAMVTIDWHGKGGADLDALALRYGLTPSAAAQLSELYESWYAWWTEWLPDGCRVAYEVPYAWNVRTWSARLLPSDGPRDYSAILPDEVPCTLDAVVGAPDGSVTVVDLKTGRRQHASAATHAQLATGALCVAHAAPGGPYETVRVVLAKVMPGAVYVDSAELDTETLDLRALSLAHHLDALPTARPTPGRHCSDLFCPMLGTCEGPRALALRAPELAAALPSTVETEGQAAAVLGSMKAMQAWLDAMKRSAVEWAETHGGRVRMPDGTVQVRAPQTRRTVDVGRAEPVLRARFGETMSDLVKVKRSVSVTEVERAAELLGPSGRKKVDVEARRAMRAAVLSDLDRAGAVRASAFSQWEEERPALPVKGEVL